MITSLCEPSFLYLALGSVMQGDRIWWTWNGLDMPNDFTLMQLKANHIEDKQERNSPCPPHCCIKPENIFKTILKTVGVYSITLEKCGLGMNIVFV